MKPCVKCGSVDRYTDGHCRPCAVARVRARAHREPEKIQAERAARRPAYLEYMRGYNARYYVANGDACRAASRAFARANPQAHRATIAACKAKKPELYRATAARASSKWARANPEKVKKQNARWRKENPEAMVGRRDRSNAQRRKKATGWSREMYDAAILAQAGKCAICAKEKKLVADHCHKVGRPRELLCAACNHAEGLLYSDPEIARAMLAYIEKWYIRPAKRRAKLVSDWAEAPTTVRSSP